MVKQPTTFKDQLALIKQRGCIVDDDAFALKVLEDTNYYRLSAYFLPFKDGDRYKSGTNFSTVYNIYEFDRKLRLLLLAVMEGLETRLRSQIAYVHSHKYGALGYLDASNFNSKHNASVFANHVNDMIAKNRHTPIVSHHISNYGGQLPIWAIVELFTFGTLSIFYSDMKRVDQKAISRLMFNRSDKELRSWLFCLTYLRNACAHYSRLYYTLFLARPAAISGLNYVMDRKLFDYILITKTLNQGTFYWDKEFLPAFLNLMDNQDYLDLTHIGFPVDWRSYFA